MVIIRCYSSGLLKLLFISMAAIASGRAVEGVVRFDDDYPCQGTVCRWVSPPPVLNPCGPLGECSSSPTPHRRSKSTGQFVAAPGPNLHGQPSLPPSVWEPPPPLTQLPPLTSSAPPPVDSIAAPPSTS